VILVDTGYFIALLEPSDALHPHARAWAAKLVDRLLVTEYVLVETVNWLSSPAQQTRVHELVSAVHTNPQYTFVRSTPQLLSAGLNMHAQYRDKEWSLTDCISFDIMHQRKIARALAYDQHFEQAGFVAMLRQMPAE
jgi:predicted nucleic acid-binding protein